MCDSLLLFVISLGVLFCSAVYLPERSCNKKRISYMLIFTRYIYALYLRVDVSVVQWLSRSPNTRKVPSSSLGGNKYFTVVLTQTASLLNHLKPLLCYVMLSSKGKEMCVYIRFIRKKTSVDKPLLEYMNKKLNTR